MIEASVIIGTLNQKEILKQTLESLFKQTFPREKYEIILVDSMSSDGTEEMIKNLNPPCKFTYLRQENKGKVNARNNALRKAVGEFILFTDSDIPCKTNWIEEHLKYQKQFKDAAITGQTTRVRSETVTDTELPTKFKHLQKIPWSYFLTGNLSIRRKTILLAGFFDESFKEYGWEDIELGYRLNKMGVYLYFLPTAQNHHIHPVAEKDFLKIMYKMGKSAAIFYKKHPNLQIKLFLGFNPIAMGLHSLIKKLNLLGPIESKAQNSKFFRYILKQYNYLEGAKETLKHG